jgi:hypothetical protein
MHSEKVLGMFRPDSDRGRLLQLILNLIRLREPGPPLAPPIHKPFPWRASGLLPGPGLWPLPFVFLSVTNGQSPS